jgi:hypothetical protein
MAGSDTEPDAPEGISVVDEVAGLMGGDMGVSFVMGSGGDE